MKHVLGKNIILLLMAVMFLTTINATAGSTDRPWLEEWSGTNDAMNGVAAFNGGTVLAVTHRGEIRRKTATEWWKSVYTTDVTLNKVRAIPQTALALAVGDHGIVLRTTDYGTSWLRYDNTQLSRDAILKNVSVLNMNTYICIGELLSDGIILSTDSYGWMWTTHNVSEENALTELVDIAVSQDSVVYIVGNHYYRDHKTDPKVFVLRSTNSGKNWQKIILPATFSAIGTAITVTNNTVVLSGVDYVHHCTIILHSSSSGEQWATYPWRSNTIIRCLKFMDNDTTKLFGCGYQFNENSTVTSKIVRISVDSMFSMNFGGNGEPNDVLLDMGFSTLDWYAVGEHGTILQNTWSATPPALSHDLDSIVVVYEGDPFRLSTGYDWLLSRTEWRKDGEILINDTIPSLIRQYSTLADSGYYEVRYIGYANRVTRSRLCKVIVKPRTTTVKDDSETPLYASPNPCNDYFIINTNNTIQSYSLYSAIGELVRTSTTDTYYVDTASIPNGMYVLTTHFSNGHILTLPISVVH